MIRNGFVALMDFLDPRFKKDKERIKAKRKYKKRKVPFRKLFKWAFYTLEMISLASAFGSIYDTLRLRVQPVVHCFAYGLEKRCNWGIFTCFLGIMFAMYSLTTSVFIEFMTIPNEMKIHETPFFLGFKFGLTFLVRRRLYKWHIEKIKKKYFTRRYHPWDLIMKMTRLGTMIGADVRNVRRNIIRANTFQLLTIILVMYFEEPLFRWFICDTMQQIKWHIRKRWKRFYQRSGIYFLVHFSLQRMINIVRKRDYPFGLTQGVFFSRQIKEECMVFFMQIFFRYLVY